MTTIQHVWPQIREAQQAMRRRRSQGWSALNELFRAGSPPLPMPDGIYKGEMIALNFAPGVTQVLEGLTSLYMPWRGKHFDEARQGGDNIFDRSSYRLARVIWPLYRGYVDAGPRTYRSFAFRTYIGPGLADPDRQVLKLDYDQQGNPAWSVRRVVDELVQVDDDVYLGKAHLHWLWGTWQLVAYFTLTK